MEVAEEVAVRDVVVVLEFGELGIEGDVVDRGLLPDLTEDLLAGLEEDVVGGRESLLHDLLGEPRGELKRADSAHHLKVVLAVGGNGGDGGLVRESKDGCCCGDATAVPLPEGFLEVDSEEVGHFF